LERKLGFTISPYYDRATCNPFQYQLGYLDVVVQPFLSAWTDFLPTLKPELIVKGLDENRKLLLQKIEETKDRALASRQQLTESQTE
jgi:hypothetical protein